MRKTILITAGPTIERIDPVRFLSNFSSGKMGYALALEATKRGYSVILVSGPTSISIPKNVEFIPVESAQDMHRQVMQNYKRANIIICVAAVADYRPVVAAKQKIKKTKTKLTLKLIKNPDILADLGKRKKAGQILVGFAAETENLIRNAKRKLKEKNCDWIIANPVGKKDSSIGGDYSRAILISKTKQINFPSQSKKTLAKKIINYLFASIRSSKPFKLQWSSIKGTQGPSVSLDDRDRLYDFLDNNLPTSLQ